MPDTRRRYSFRHKKRQPKMARDGYGRVYRRGFDLLLRFLVWRGVHHDSADDTAQGAWIKGWEPVAQLPNESLVVPWGQPHRDQRVSEPGAQGTDQPVASPSARGEN